VTFTDDQCRFVKNGTVYANLSWEPLKRVGIALNFVPVERTIHDGNIDAGDPVTKTKLGDHKRVRFTLMSLEHFAVQCPANVDIAHCSLSVAPRF